MNEKVSTVFTDVLNILKPIAETVAPFWAILWAIQQHNTSKYKHFIDSKDDEILSKILKTYYETIELNLFKTINRDNYTFFLQKIKELVNQLRSDGLFFYLGSSLTKIILQIETEFIKNPSSNISENELKVLNKYFFTFSYHYFSLSWKIRRNLKIESNEYLYRKRLNILTYNDEIEYKLRPSYFFKNFIAYLVILIVTIPILLEKVPLFKDLKLASEIISSLIVAFPIIYYARLYTLSLIAKFKPLFYFLTNKVKYKHSNKNRRKT